jgi:hypothetical protein
VNESRSETSYGNDCQLIAPAIGTLT